MTNEEYLKILKYLLDEKSDVNLVSVCIAIGEVLPNRQFDENGMCRKGVNLTSDFKKITKDLYGVDIND